MPCAREIAVKLSSLRNQHESDHSPSWTVHWLAMTGPILPSLHNWAWKTLDFYPVDVAVKVVSNGT